MDNQHRKIKGYRELTQEEIDLMNEIKSKGEELDTLINILESRNVPRDGNGNDQTPESRRWVGIGKDHMQQGLMALTRSVALPTFF